MYNYTGYTLPFQRVGEGHSEEKLYWINTETQQAKLQILYLHVWCYSVVQMSNPFHFCCLEHIFLS